MAKEEKRRYEADPLAMAASPELVRVMCSGGNRNGLSGNTDHRPMVYRPGALDCNKYPSRIGSKLFYRDGRVEDVA